MDCKEEKLRVRVRVRGVSVYLPPLIFRRSRSCLGCKEEKFRARFRVMGFSVYLPPLRFRRSRSCFGLQGRKKIGLGLGLGGLVYLARNHAAS